MNHPDDFLPFPSDATSALAPTVIVFVEADVADYQLLLDGLPPGAEVHVLDPGLDGLAGIAAVLKGRSGIDALHIVSHGSEGAVSLGALQLRRDNLAGHADDLATIRQALHADADILLYGCSVGAGTAGAAFVDALAGATGADVAASTDLTGATALGGNWTLERSSGAIAAGNPLSTLSLASYSGILAVNGLADGTYDFGGADSPPNSGGAGFVRFSDKFDISNGIGVDGTVMYAADQTTSDTSGSITIKVGGSAGVSTLTFKDLAFSFFENFQGFSALSIITRDVASQTIGSHVLSGSYMPNSTNVFSASAILNGGASFADNAVASITITWKIVATGPDPEINGPDNLNFNSITVANVSTAPPPNTAPSFVGANTPLALTTNAGATDFSSLVRVSDTDSAQTLTWTQTSSPANGTLVFTPSTQASGGASITPGGTLTYRPNAGFAGNDTFTIQVSDGAATANRTITVNVAPSTPGAPDLSGNAAVDTGVSQSDNITNAGTLSFSGTSAAGDSSSTVRVFVDSNGNATYDAGTDATGTATVNDGVWTVNGINVASLADGNYNVYSTVMSASGSLVSARSAGLGITLDRTAPTLAITSNSAALKAGETATITFTFSEDPGATFTWDGSVGDVQVSGGTLSAISGSGVIRTATFTPTASTNSGAASISVPGAAWTDTAGNSGGAGATPALTFDTLAPAVTSINRIGTATSNATSVQYAVTFDSGVTGVGAGDFQLTGTGGATGTIAGVTGSGTTYTVTVNNISGDGTLRLDLKNAGTGIADSAGNAVPGYTSGQSYTFDFTSPSVTSVLVPASATYGAGDPLEFTVNFNEAVTVDTTNGTPSLPLTLDNGGTVQAAYVSGSGGTALTFRYTVVAGNADADGIVLNGPLSFNGGTIRDTAGNAAATTLNAVGATTGILVDALAPAVTGIVRVGNELTNATSVMYAVTFSDSVTGVDASDFTLVASGGVTANIGAVSGSGANWSVTVNNIAGDGVLRLDLNASGTGIQGGSGQAIAGGYTAGQNYTVDQTAPTLSGAIELTDTALTAGDTATVTFRFSEAVQDFTVADVTVANGVLSNLMSVDGGQIWTATLTPLDSVTDATNTLTLNYAGVNDLAGNAGTGVATSTNYAIDTAGPTLASAITISNTTLAIGSSATVTFTFNEAVTGFSGADITVPNGTLSALTSSDGGITWTATLAPASASSDATNTLTLDYTGLTDLAGNTGTGTASSGNYRVDTVRPSLASSISISDTTLTSGNTATVTFTFTEAVSGFSLADVTVPNGVLQQLASDDGGITWTATLTPTAGTSAPGNVLTLDYTGLTDLAGNAGAGSVQSGNYAVDTAGPALAQPIAIDDTALRIGDTATVTFVFDQSVTGFTAANVTVPNGTLSALGSNDGITWTATLTPNPGATAAGNVLTLDYAGIENAVGNSGAGSATSGNYAVDTLAPTATVTLSDVDLRAGETAQLTIAFNEIVSGFDASAVTAPNGALGTFTTLDAGMTWRATFTPDTNILAASNVVAVSLANVADLAGNPGAGNATSPNYAVQTTPPVTPPTNPPASDTIDGVAVQTDILPVDPVTGLPGQALTVPIITGTRSDDPATPNGNLADIPLGLGTGAGPRTELMISLPVGTGMRAEGPSSLLTSQQALLDLILRIDKQTEDGSSAQSGMTGNGAGFLDSLAPGTLLQSQTIVLSAAPDLSAPPTILINGSSITPVGGGQNATAIGLVIDATGLPAGSTLQLSNVDFAAIVGEVTVRGGAGRNFVTGDDAIQNILLGADDDVLLGGGGNDIIGSAGGDDLLDGGSGNDILVGGIGNDRLAGGAGDNVLQGGRSTQGAWAFYLSADGALTARHETALFAPGQVERLVLAELNASAAELAFLDADKPMLSSISLLYHAALGRAPDLGGLVYWAQDGVTPRAAAAHVLASPEWLAASGNASSDAGFIEAVYGNAFGRMPDGAGLTYWLGQLTGSATAPAISRADALLAIAQSAEHERAWNTADGYLIGADGVVRETDWIVDDGVDLGVYAGTTADYKFIIDADGRLNVEDKASGNLDQLAGIDIGDFSDGMLDLGFLQDGPAQVKLLGLLYQTVLDRAGDLAGFQWWLGRDIDSTQLVQDFVASTEFKLRYDSINDAAFVQALYDNSGLSAGAAGGQASWESFLTSHTRAELIATWLNQDGVVDAQFAGAGLWVV
ncbi:DUF4347 domain-containing protein [Oxalobacteraceae sp. CFBP 8763]|nr:DUF4347 domain-containing protein [Oxalobacteraceae sp. CFBP 8763]